MNNILISIPVILAAACIGIFIRVLMGKDMKFANEIATLNAQKKYKEAIEFGESNPKLEGLALMNMAIAYYSLGNKQKAQEIINKVKLPFYYHSSIKKTLSDWKDKIHS